MMQNDKKGSSALAKLFLQKFLQTGYKFAVNFKGVGISLIDNEPKEIIYISVYSMQFMIEQVSQVIRITVLVD